MGIIRAAIKGLGVQRAGPLERFEPVLHSLHARGLASEFRELPDSRGYVIQWARGNFGHRLTLDARGREFQATPVALQVGPYADEASIDCILPMQDWREIGPAVSLGRVRTVGHNDLIESIRLQALEHPCLAWFAGRFQALAEGQRPPGEDLAAMVLLGVGRFMKSIPNTDRLHERIAPSIVTLLKMASREKALGAAGDVIDFGFATEPGYAQAILEFAQDSHPQEARRAIRAHAMR